MTVLEPLQQRYREIRESGELHRILAEGKERAAEQAERMLKEVKTKMGFVVL